ncbi:MAG: hypothetical protein NTX88_02450, partial [Candidatus Atribacteria bacterium]|nr:hypothetical protein [Candidatus Atribacteria bacterium]
MSKKNIVILAVVCTSILFLITGCIGGGQFGAPGTGTATIKGRVALPKLNGANPLACYVVAESNLLITDGEPLPNATVILKGNNGNDLVTTTNAKGEYEATGAIDSTYVLYANTTGTNVWVKKAITPVEQGKVNDGGEANATTTAQVIIYEVAATLYNVAG